MAQEGIDRSQKTHSSFEWVTLYSSKFVTFGLFVIFKQRIIKQWSMYKNITKKSKQWRMIKTIWFGVGMYNISENTKLLQHGMKFIQEIVTNWKVFVFLI